MAAVQALRNRLPALLPATEAEDLEDRLSHACDIFRDPAQRTQAVTLALDAIEQFPEARNNFRDLLRQQLRQAAEAGEEAATEETATRGYQPVPGEPQPVAPGILMVCPLNPEHYRRRLRAKGQRLRCPQHGVDLIPAGSSELKGGPG